MVLKVVLHLSVPLVADHRHSEETIKEASAILMSKYFHSYHSRDISGSYFGDIKVHEYDLNMFYLPDCQHCSFNQC